MYMRTGSGMKKGETDFSLRDDENESPPLEKGWQRSHGWRSRGINTRKMSETIKKMYQVTIGENVA